VDTNLGKTKLTNILKQRIIVADANAKNPDQLDHLIADMAEMKRLECGWEDSSVDVEENFAPF